MINLVCVLAVVTLGYVSQVGGVYLRHGEEWILIGIGVICVLYALIEARKQRCS